MKQLHARGHLASEPDLPEVCDTQNIVQYYFPGSLTKLILGTPEVSLGDGNVSLGGGDALATLKAVVYNEITVYIESSEDSVSID